MQRSKSFVQSVLGAAGITALAVATASGQTALRKGEYDTAPLVVDGKAPLAAGRLVAAVSRPGVAVEENTILSLHDRVYFVPPPGAPPRVGDTLTVVADVGRVKKLGRIIAPRARLVVERSAVGGPWTGRLVKQYGEVAVGLHVMRIENAFVPAGAPVRGAYPVVATIRWIPHEPVLPSLQTYVVLDATAASGVRAGDQFTLYEPGRKTDAGTTPPVPTATIQVVRTTPFGVTGIVVEQREPQIREGMAARLTARVSM